jgi:hypothetical protein
MELALINSLMMTASIHAVLFQMVLFERDSKVYPIAPEHTLYQPLEGWLLCWAKPCLGKQAICMQTAA